MAETPDEESARIKHQKLIRLETRRSEKTWHENAQNKGSEVKTPKISPFRVINEENSERKAEESTGNISPLWKDTMPHLYNDPVQPSTSVTMDGKNERAAAGEEEEVEEVEVSYKEPEIVQIDSKIHSELDYDDDGGDYEQEELGINEERNTAQIKMEPRGDRGEEEEELYGYEEDQ